MHVSIFEGNHRRADSRELYMHSDINLVTSIIPRITLPDSYLVGLWRHPDAYYSKGDDRGVRDSRLEKGI